MCNLCPNLQKQVARLEDQVVVLEERLKELVGELTLPFSDITLTATELKILNFLVNTPGYASRRAIISAVYPDPFDDAPVERAVDAMVVHIRRQLIMRGLDIETKVGIGYYLSPTARRELLRRRITAEETACQI